MARCRRHQDHGTIQPWSSLGKIRMEPEDHWGPCYACTSINLNTTLSHCNPQVAQGSPLHRCRDEQIFRSAAGKDRNRYMETPASYMQQHKLVQDALEAGQQKSRKQNSLTSLMRAPAPEHTIVGRGPYINAPRLADPLFQSDFHSALFWGICHMGKMSVASMSPQWGHSGRCSVVKRMSVPAG